MLTGADLRRYRRRLDWTQPQFAERLGISQPALSRLEAGKTSLSDEYLEQLRQRFVGKSVSVPFADFVRGLQDELSTSQTALTSSAGRYVTLSVWPWEEGFDLSNPLRPRDAVDLVTIRASGRACLAFRMPGIASTWVRDEILVFEEATLDAVAPRELVLVQWLRGRSKGTRSAIAIADGPAGPNARVTAFQPLTPAGPAVPADETVRAVLALVYRGAYVRATS